MVKTLGNLLNDQVVHYFARRIVSSESIPPDERDELLVLLCKGHSEDERYNYAAIQGVREALQDRFHVKKPEGWDKLDFSERPAHIREVADDIAIKFGDEKIIAAMTERAKEGEARAITLLANRKTAGFQKVLLGLLSNPAVRMAAIRGLGHYNAPETPTAILDLYAKLTADEKADAIQTLTSRASYALALLDAVEKGTVPKADITAFTARQITVHKDAALLKKLGAVWGEVKPASATRTAQIKKYKELLTPDAIKAGDAGIGRFLFAKNCATCHKLFGEGQGVGPELTGAQRGNLDYILENVVDPSAVVANEYKMHEFQLLDGRVVTGIVKKDGPQAVTVRTVNEELAIAVRDIEKRKPTQNSVRPEGLFDALKPEEVRDLVAYLMGKGQVPLPPPK